MRRIFDRLLKFYRDLPIRRKMLLILYLQILIPLILVGYMSYNISEDFIRKKSIDNSEVIAKSVELRIKDYTKNLELLSQELEYDDKIYEILRPADLSVETANSNEDDDEMTGALNRIKFSRSEIESICFVRDEDFKVYSSASSGVDAGSIIRQRWSDILKATEEKQGRPLWYLNYEDNKISSIFFIRRIRNRENFRDMALMAIVLRKDYFETFYKDLDTKEKQTISILSSDNHLIVSSNIKDLYVPSGEKFNSATGFTGIDNDRGVLVTLAQMEDPDWKIVTNVYLDDLYHDIDILRWWILVLSLASLFLVSILGLFMAVDFIQPIKKLVSAMKKMPKGENFAPVEVDRGDELGFLKQAFNDMGKEINHLVTWVYREQLTRKEAEVKALQAQINPHFLFNTLESINWMAQLNNVPEISETVSALSSLMEAGIGRDDKLIPLREEFTYIDNYISILKVRFEDRIELRKTVQEKVLSVEIPRLLIQPLIENAVYHGIEKIRGKGVIQLKAFTKEGTLVIEVEDNGPGMEPEELERLNEKLSMSSDQYFRNLSGNKRKSIGIENVNRRIKLFYGEAYGLKIESRTGEFARVIVTVPLWRDSGKAGS